MGSVEISGQVATLCLSRALRDVPLEAIVPLVIMVEGRQDRAEIHVRILHRRGQSWDSPRQWIDCEVVRPDIGPGGFKAIGLATIDFHPSQENGNTIELPPGYALSFTPAHRGPNRS